MKIVVLKGAKAPSIDWAEKVRAKLDYPDGTELTVITLRKPPKPLPVARVLVVGESSRPFRAIATAPVAKPSTANPAATTAVTQKAAVKKAPAKPASVPVRAWRKGVRVLKANRVSGKVLRVLTLKGSPSSQFASASLTSGTILRLIGEADLVIAADIHTFRAAWLLSRLRRRPAVIAYVNGAAQWLKDNPQP